jgi:hypothetical protein
MEVSHLAGRFRFQVSRPTLNPMWRRLALPVAEFRDRPRVTASPGASLHSEGFITNPVLTLAVSPADS